MALFTNGLVEEAREIQDRIDELRKARRRRPLHDYTGRAVLLVQQRELEQELADLRRAARRAHHDSLRTDT